MIDQQKKFRTMGTLIHLIVIIGLLLIHLSLWDPLLFENANNEPPFASHDDPDFLSSSSSFSQTAVSIGDEESETLEGCVMKNFCELGSPTMRHTSLEEVERFSYFYRHAENEPAEDLDEEHFSLQDQFEEWQETEESQCLPRWNLEKLTRIRAKYERIHSIEKQKEQTSSFSSSSSFSLSPSGVNIAYFMNIKSVDSIVSLEYLLPAIYHPKHQFVFHMNADIGRSQIMKLEALFLRVKLPFAMDLLIQHNLSAISNADVHQYRHLLPANNLHWLPVRYDIPEIDPFRKHELAQRDCRSADDLSTIHDIQATLDAMSFLVSHQEMAWDVFVRLEPSSFPLLHPLALEKVFSTLFHDQNSPPFIMNIEKLSAAEVEETQTIIFSDIVHQQQESSTPVPKYFASEWQSCYTPDYPYPYQKKDLLSLFRQEERRRSGKDTLLKQSRQIYFEGSDFDRSFPLETLKKRNADLLSMIPGSVGLKNEADSVQLSSSNRRLSEFFGGQQKNLAVLKGSPQFAFSKNLTKTLLDHPMYIRNLLIHFANAKNPLQYFFPTLLSLHNYLKNLIKDQPPLMLKGKIPLCFQGYFPSEFSDSFDLAQLQQLSQQIHAGDALPLFLELHPLKSQILYRKLIQLLRNEPEENAILALSKWAANFQLPELSDQERYLAPKSKPKKRILSEIIKNFVHKPELPRRAEVDFNIVLAAWEERRNEAISLLSETISEIIHNIE